MIKLKDYKKELESMNKEIKILPDGYLTKKRKFYYRGINGKEIGITKKPELIHQLCRQRYLLTRQKQLTNNISIASYYIQNLDTTTPNEIISKLPSAYQDLPISYFFHPSVADWLAESYETNPYPLEEPGYESKNGIVFRTKSEYLISILLDEYDIPYRYDAEITLGNKTKYADFIIKNPFNGKIFIWEHFGALDKPEYIQGMNKKMNLYMKHGYIPFDTLIYTFEIDVKDHSRLRYLIENVIFN